MTTRSVVAAEFDDGVKGVYCHFDGYPSYMLEQLQKLVKRDGRDKVVETIMGKPCGWSIINHEEISSGSNDKYDHIQGYGRRYNDFDYKNYYNLGEGGEEYFYVIRKDGVVVWTSGDGIDGAWYANSVDEEEGISTPGAKHYWEPSTPVVINTESLDRIITAVHEVMVDNDIPKEQTVRVIEKLLIQARQQGAEV